ncbi:MAG: glycosyltransferase [Candidatus Andersenbacteria bacterium]|nr:glycosyltransferase [Candidatus Andersenbacteria bacterium]
MKFAVVEYTSKSGGVWRASQGKPNFLADPDKEIDPTSFGCYVSAFEGEHIPLKGLITGSVGHISPAKVLLRRAWKRITGRFPATFDLSYLTQFDALLIVHQISDGHEITSLVRRLKKQNPRPYMIGVPTQPFGILQDYAASHPIWQADFKEYMGLCDVFLTIVESTLPQWQRLTDTPVVYAAQPYPVEYASTYVKAAPKNPILFVSGVTDRKHIARGQSVARELQKKFPEYAIHVTDTPGHRQNLVGLTGTRYATQPFLPWSQQLQYLAQVKLVINTDFTQTRGRVQTDCAAVGTPSIGADSDAQRDLYPDFYADENTSVDVLVQQGSSLLQDQALYAKTTALARQQLKKYTYETCKQNIIDVMEKYPKRI